MSPYSNLEAEMEQLGSDYVISFKPNSNYLSGPKCDMTYLKDELIHACKLARKYKANIVVNMKTIIYLRDDPTRLWQWCDMASDIVEQY